MHLHNSELVTPLKFPPVNSPASFPYCTSVTFLYFCEFLLSFCVDSFKLFKFFRKRGYSVALYGPYSTSVPCVQVNQGMFQ